MKIELEVSDFYLDEDDNIEECLKNNIKRDVLYSIQKSIKEKVEAQIELEVKRVVEAQLYTTISQNIKEVVATGQTKSRHNSGKMVTIEEYVRECFEYTGGWQSFEDTIKKQCQVFAAELKQRYDMAFASQIVNKLHENQLLKEDVANFLLKP